MAIINDGITVVIPNYNNAKYLEQCVESVFNQSYSNLYVVVVDDCSNDNSREILEKLAKRYTQKFKVFYLDQNEGVSNARNIGLNMVTTDCVTFLDSDDFYYNKDKIKNEMQLYNQMKKTVAEPVVYSKIAYVTEQGKLRNIHFKREKYYSGAGRKAFYDFMSGNNWSILPRDYIVSKKLLTDIGAYSYRKNLYEDVDLLIRLSFNALFFCTGELGTAYRNTTAGLSQKSKKEKRLVLADVRNQYKKNMYFFEKILIIVLKLRVFFDAVKIKMELIISKGKCGF